MKFQLTKIDTDVSIMKFNYVYFNSASRTGQLELKELLFEGWKIHSVTSNNDGFFIVLTIQ